MWHNMIDEIKEGLWGLSTSDYPDNGYHRDFHHCSDRL